MTPDFDPDPFPDIPQLAGGSSAGDRRPMSKLLVTLALGPVEPNLAMWVALGLSAGSPMQQYFRHDPKNPTLILEGPWLDDSNLVADTALAIWVKPEPSGKVVPADRDVIARRKILRAGPLPAVVTGFPGAVEDIADCTLAWRRSWLPRSVDPVTANVDHGKHVRAGVNIVTTSSYPKGWPRIVELNDSLFLNQQPVPQSFDRQLLLDVREHGWGAAGRELAAYYKEHSANIKREVRAVWRDNVSVSGIARVTSVGLDTLSKVFAVKLPINGVLRVLLEKCDEQLQEYGRERNWYEFIARRNERRLRKNISSGRIACRVGSS